MVGPPMLKVSLLSFVIGVLLMIDRSPISFTWRSVTWKESAFGTSSSLCSVTRSYSMPLASKDGPYMLLDRCEWLASDIFPLIHLESFRERPSSTASLGDNLNGSMQAPFSSSSYISKRLILTGLSYYS